MKSLYFIAGMAFGAFLMHRHMKNKKVNEEPIFLEEDEVKETKKEEKPKVTYNRNTYSKPSFTEVEEVENINHSIPHTVVDALNRYYGYNETQSENNPNIDYISADEFAAEDEWDVIGLTYYKDGILADDDNSIIEDPVELVGDFEPHFGEFEEDVVYVKNNQTHCYYEILKDSRKYEEIPRPHRGILNERYR